MLNIVLSENVINNIDNFINWYRKIFLEKFIDTWIFNEDLIRKSYIEIATEFRNNIYIKINELNDDTLLWRMLINDNIYWIFINIWNYKIFLIYRDFENVRFFEDIKIYKK